LSIRSILYSSSSSNHSLHVIIHGLIALSISVNDVGTTDATPTVYSLPLQLSSQCVYHLSPIQVFDCHPRQNLVCVTGSPVQVILGLTLVTHLVVLDLDHLVKYQLNVHYVDPVLLLQIVVHLLTHPELVVLHVHQIHIYFTSQVRDHLLKHLLESFQTVLGHHLSSEGVILVHTVVHLHLVVVCSVLE